MDIFSVIGVIGAIVCLIEAVGIHALSLFFNPDGVIIIFGGMIFVGLLNFPIAAIRSLPRVVAKCFTTPTTDMRGVIERMVSFAVIARRDGLLALEEKLKELDDPFMLRGIKMTIDGIAPESVRAILTADIEQMAIRHNAGKGMLEYYGASAPAFGMVATLIGLVKMLANLSDPSSLGPSMSLALVATFYGAASANFIFLPLAGKLHERNIEELMARNLMIEGILAIQGGENPNVIRERLLSYLPPDERADATGPSRVRERVIA